jgi:hypothetical protein
VPQLPSKQVQGVENPATVLLIPMVLGDGASWWSHDGALLGGIQIAPQHSAKIMYLPRPIPRSWGEKEFNVCVEYEGDSAALFKLRLLYGCGDPSELRLGETDEITGETGKIRRLRFRLNPELIHCNQLFRCTLSIARSNGGNGEVLIYGAWMEVGA